MTTEKIRFLFFLKLFMIVGKDSQISDNINTAQDEVSTSNRRVPGWIVEFECDTKFDDQNGRRYLSVIDK